MSARLIKIDVSDDLADKLGFRKVLAGRENMPTFDAFVGHMFPCLIGPSRCRIWPIDPDAWRQT